MKVSGIISEARQRIIALEGKITRSEFYLTADDGDKIEFCMTPEEMRVKSSASFRSYNVIEVGEIKIPKGEQLTAIMWRGILPGSPMLMYRFVKSSAWEQPKETIKTLQRWREDGKKLRLLVTQTPVNLDVYIKAFDYTAKGGLGNYHYDIELTAAKPLQVKTVAEADADRARAVEEKSFELLTRTAMKSRTGIFVGQLNTLWEVAQLLTGNGANWQNLLLQNGLSNPDLNDPSTWIMY